MVTLYEEDHVPGSKYPGKTIGEIAGIDPGYLQRIQSTSRKFCISDEVMDNLDKYRQNYKKKKPGNRLLGTAQEVGTD